MSKVLGGVLRGKNFLGELYFIHLKTGVKVSAHTSGINKIQLIQDEIYEDEMEYIVELQKAGEISIDTLNNLNKIYESQNIPKDKKNGDSYDEIFDYFEKQKAYIELTNAIHAYYMPKIKCIVYSFYHREEPEWHTVKYGY